MSNASVPSLHASVASCLPQLTDLSRMAHESCRLVSLHALVFQEAQRARRACPVPQIFATGNEYLERCNGTPAFLAPEMMKPNTRYR